MYAKRNAGAIGPHEREKAPSPGPSIAAADSLLRERDSNARPSGYEPDELPLLHPAIVILSRYLVPKKSWIQRITRLARSASLCDELVDPGDRSTAIRPSPCLMKS